MPSNAARAPQGDALRRALATSVAGDGGRTESDVAPLAEVTRSGRPLSILLAVPTLDGGAAAAGVVELVGVLRRFGHTALVVAHGGRRGDEVRRRGGHLVELDVAGVNPAMILANGIRMAGLIRRHGCDVVHAHGRAAAWSGCLAARLSRRPFVTTWYKGFRDQNALKWLYNSSLARADRVIATSDQIADLVLQRYGPRHLTVIPPGVDLHRFDPAGISPERIEAVRHHFGVGERVKLVLAPARILRRKGHQVVVRAVQRLKALGVTDFACVFASEDAGTRYAGELWDQVLASDTADLVRLSGPMEDIPAVYAAATVVVSASTQADGLPRALLEAQAMARPVVVSDLGAGPEALLAFPDVPEERATGLRVPAGDSEALAVALIRIFAMPEPARRAMGARGRAWVAASFDPDDAAARILRVYADTVRLPHAAERV
jgi:glycosyltransferase involved in cell wall biosynthesis